MSHTDYINEDENEEDDDFIDEDEDEDEDETTLSGNSEYDTLVTTLNQVQKGAKKAVVSLLTSFLEAHPEVAALRWVQYTPSFNDGDACTFTMGDIELALKLETTEDSADEDEEHADNKKEEEEEEEEEEYEGDEDDDNYDNFVGPYSLRQEYPALSAALENLNRSANDTIFEAAFGDGVQVTASREGFSIVEYYDEY